MVFFDIILIMIIKRLRKKISFNEIVDKYSFVYI